MPRCLRLPFITTPFLYNLNLRFLLTLSRLQLSILITLSTSLLRYIPMTLPAFLSPLIQHLVHHYWHSIIAILPYLAATFSQHLPHPAPIDFTLLTISIRLSHTAVSLFSLPRLLPFPYPMMSSTPFPTTLYDSSLWNSSIMPIFPYRVICQLLPSLLHTLVTCHGLHFHRNSSLIPDTADHFHHIHLSLVS